MTPASGGPGGDLRWRSSLRLSPAPPIYEVMGDHGSPAGTSGCRKHPRGAKSPGLGCRSKGMAVRGLVSGGDPR